MALQNVVLALLSYFLALEARRVVFTGSAVISHSAVWLFTSGSLGCLQYYIIIFY